MEILKSKAPTKYWYVIKLKDGTILDFSSYQLQLLDLSKSLFVLNYISNKWADKINNVRIPTSEILFVKHGEDKDD